MNIFIHAIFRKGLVFLVLTFIFFLEGFSQTTTVTSGNWNTGNTWSTGTVPGNGTPTTVNHSVVLDKDISPTVLYTINSPVIDQPGAPYYNITVSENLDVNANMHAEGTLQMNGGLFDPTYLTIRTGDTLVIGYPGSTANSNIDNYSHMTIEAGGVLIVYGNLEVEGGGDINCDGTILIDGNFHADNALVIFSSEVTGSGTITTTGTMTSDGGSEIFGSGTNCNTGPCTSTTPCGIAHGLGSNQSICPGTIPATITGSNPGGTSHKWQKSTTSAFVGFIDIPGATNYNLTFSSGVGVTTWYRRVSTVTAGGCVSNSSAIKISMTAPLPVSVSITSTSTNFCIGTNVTFTATPVNGGVSPSYQWKVNGSDVGTNSATYATASLANGDIVTCVLTSSGGTCVSGSPATSGGITVTVTNPVTASVSISTTLTTMCTSPGSRTFTAVPTNGGTTPFYQWKKNGINVGTNSTTYTNTTWVNGEVVTCEMTSNNTCVTGSPATSNAVTITVTGGGSGNWIGTSSTNWNTNSNWCSNTRPVAATNVVLNGGVSNQPSITSNAAVCTDLTINSGATLTVNGNTLAIGGNLVINSGGTMIVANTGSAVNVAGSITINSGGILIINNSTVTVIGSLTINAGGILTITSPGALSVRTNITNTGSLSGTGTTTINGTTAQLISGIGTYGNITVNKATGACTVISPVTISGVLTLAAGVVTSGGNLTVDLNAGSIAWAATNTGTIAGNIIVSKTVNSPRYHYISSPLMNSMTFAEWDDDVTLVSGPYNSLYYYDETNTSPIDIMGWTATGSNLANPIVTLKGYALFFKNLTTIDQTGTYTHGAIPANVTLTNTVSTDLNVDGWNLVGNPYPSTIDWDAASGWTKTGIGNAIYFWDPVNDRYSTYVGGLGTFLGSRYIPSMQAFWVRVNASGGTGTFGMNNNVRVTNQNPSLWRTASSNNDANILKLTVSSGIYSDETIIRFRDDVANDFDDQMDAYKLKNDGNTPSLYTMLGQEQYAINSLSDTTADISIPLHLKVGFTGEYIMNAEEIGAFDSYDITLDDELLDVTHDLKAIPSYTFQVNSGDTTGRFFINFKKSAVTGVNNQYTSSKVSIRSTESTVYFNFSNTSSAKDITVYNLLGRKVAEVKNADTPSGTYFLNFPGETGIYVIKVVVEGEVITQKVYLFNN